MFTHHYTPNRVVIFKDGRTACAVCADTMHTAILSAANANVYDSSIREGAPSRDFLRVHPADKCSFCGEWC